MKTNRYTPLPAPWEPESEFDWSTGGRALSEEEREILRKVLLQDREAERDAA